MVKPLEFPASVIDTETSGLFDFKQPADAPGQPRLAHFSMIYLKPDLTPDRVFDKLIKPDGWVMAPDAAAVNGLTMERLRDEGVPVADVLEEYESAVKAGRVVVAFNAQFDCKMMRAELRRAGRDDLFTVTRNICVMRPMTDICQLMPTGGRAGYKFPKLAEALQHIGHVNDAPHTATADADGALAIMRWLHERDLLPPAGVHLAKNKPDGAAPPRRSAKAQPVTGDDEIPA